MPKVFSLISILKNIWSSPANFQDEPPAIILIALFQDYCHYGGNLFSLTGALAKINYIDNHRLIDYINLNPVGDHA